MNIFTQFEKNKLEVKAFQESIANHTVVILTDGSQGVGTGTLIRYRTKRVILTAQHVLKNTNLSSLLIGFRPEGSLHEAPLRRFSTTPTPILSGEPIQILRVASDPVNDIAAIVLSRKQKVRAPAAFYDATKLRRLLPVPGASLFFLGFVSDNAIVLGPKRKALAAISDHLRYDPKLNNLKRVPASYNPIRQFLMNYGWQDELHPGGLSGTAVWCSRKSTSGVWIADPVPIGVILAYVKKLQVLIAANLESVLDLLSRL